MIIAISIITRTGYNEQIRLDFGARYMRFLLYFLMVAVSPLLKAFPCCEISREYDFIPEQNVLFIWPQETRIVVTISILRLKNLL